MTAIEKKPCKLQANVIKLRLALRARVRFADFPSSGAPRHLPLSGEGTRCGGDERRGDDERHHRAISTLAFPRGKVADAEGG